MAINMVVSGSELSMLGWGWRVVFKPSGVNQRVSSDRHESPSILLAPRQRDCDVLKPNLSGIDQIGET